MHPLKNECLIFVDTKTFLLYIVNTYIMNLRGDILLNNDLFWLYIHNIEKMNVNNFTKLYFKYKDKDSFIEALKNNEISLPANIKDEIFSEAWLKKVNGLLDYMDKRNIKVTFYHSNNYPRRLKDIEFPPPVLYYIGDYSLVEGNNVAVIGSRSYSSYGKQCTEYFCDNFAKCDICVVSGMAEGIDACAHWSALNNDGKTIAVLACGVDYIYPTCNTNLYNEICKNGLIISEFSISVRPQKPYFPYRNRLIVGFADCLLVTEAGMPSGTMTTVDHCLEQNKNVYAVPGSINSTASAGTNFLIKSGCICAVDPFDILAEFGKYRVNNDQGPIPYDEDLDDLQKDILKLLSVESLSVLELEEALSIDAASLNVALVMLEISGYVEKDAGTNYFLKR